MQFPTLIILVADLETLLIQLDALDPQESPLRNSKGDQPDDDEDHVGLTNSRTTRNIRGPVKCQDSDSDFEFDM